MASPQSRNDRIVALYQSGLTLRQVAAQCGLSFERVRQILKSRNVTRRPHRVEIDNRDYARAKRMFEDGLTIAAAADTIGVGRGVLAYRLIEDGSHSPVNITQEWTRSEIAVLRKTYRVISAREIAERLGRTRDEVIGKAYRLGLSAPKQVLEAAE